MSHELFHILSHLAIHAYQHLTKSHGEPAHGPTPGCRECRATTGTMYATHCCQARLCASCVKVYERGCHRTCPFCGDDVVRK